MSGSQVTTMVTTPLELRRNDYSLSAEESAVAELFSAFFRQECPTTQVRAAEPLGYDEALWKRLAEVGALSMAIPSDHGGDGASFVELVLMAEQAGTYLAPVPLIETVCALRMLSRAGSGAHLGTLLSDIAAGETLSGVALGRWEPGIRQLVPGGAVARAVVGVDADDVVLVEADEPPPHAANLGSAPLAWWSPAADRTARFPVAMDSDPASVLREANLEWKLLTAAALNGLAGGALDLGVGYAKQRPAWGTLIGAYQAVSHPLVDAAIAAEGSTRLTRKAAWFWEHERERAAPLVVRAFRYAVDASCRAATVTLHVHGGFGVTLEADIQLFFRRAKGWPMIGGAAHDDYLYLADLERATGDQSSAGRAG